MENGLSVKDVVVDLFCAFNNLSLDIQAAFIDALEDFICSWLILQKLPCTQYKFWKNEFFGNTPVCTTFVQSQDVRVMFAGSRLISELLGCIQTQVIQNREKNPVVETSVAEVICSTAYTANTDVQSLYSPDQLSRQSMLESVVPAIQLNGSSGSGELSQLVCASETPNGASACSSAFCSATERTDTDSVNSIQFAELPAYRALDCDTKTALLNDTELFDKRHDVKSKVNLKVNLPKPLQNSSLPRKSQRVSQKSESRKVAAVAQQKQQLKQTSPAKDAVLKSTDASVPVKEEAGEQKRRNRKKSADRVDDGDIHPNVRAGLLLGQTVCEICGAVVKCLKSHMLKHGDPTHHCPFCPFASRQLQSVNIHVRRRHTNYRPHLCEECGKSFVKSTLLKEHIREKHGLLKKERRYQCSVCNYMAYTRSILARHEAKHESNRRPAFRCDECGARLMTVHSLKEHKQLSHTDARPFPCALCGFAAKSVKRLRSHMRTHGDKSFECGICAKKFTLRPQLIRHQLVHSGDKPFSCPCCVYRCAIVENLRKHCRAVHKLIYPPKKRDVRDEICAPNVVVPLPGANLSVIAAGNINTAAAAVDTVVPTDSTTVA